MRIKRTFMSLTGGLSLILGLVGLLVIVDPSKEKPGPWLVRAAGPLYVASDGIDDANNCAESANPCATVQHAVDIAQAGDEIRVAAGTYTNIHSRGDLTQVVYITKSVTIRGGYTTTNWTTSNPTANRTTLDAQGQGRVLCIIGDLDVNIEGLSITGGNADRLGGRRAEGKDAGGGVYVISATLALSNSQVFNNSADLGGGLYMLQSTPTLNSNIITHNQAEGGAGLYLFQSTGSLTDNAITFNTAERTGGGVFLRDSTADLYGNTIRANRARQGGGLFMRLGSSAVLSNNTIVSNTASLFFGGG